MATVSTLSTTSQLSGPPVAPDVAAPGSEVAGAFQAILQPLLTTGSASASEQVATTVASLQVATQQAADPRLDAGPPAIPTMVPNNGPQDTQATGASSPASKSKTGHKPTAAIPVGDTETQDTSGCAATCVASAVASPPVPNPVTTLATAADPSGSRSAEETVGRA